MAVFFLGMFISSALVHHIRHSSLMSQFHAKVQIEPVLEGILSVATICWRVIVLEIAIPKLLPYSWIPEGR